MLRPAYLLVYIFQQNVEPVQGVRRWVSIKIPRWELQGKNAEQPGGAHPGAEARLV